MTWVNLAVGIIGSEDNPLNVVFVGVLAIGIVGAFIARFQPRGMARAMVAVGIAQVLVAVAALIGGHGRPDRVLRRGVVPVCLALPEGGRGSDGRPPDGVAAARCLSSIQGGGWVGYQASSAFHYDL